MFLRTDKVEYAPSWGNALQCDYCGAVFPIAIHQTEREYFRRRYCGSKCAMLAEHHGPQLLMDIEMHAQIRTEEPQP